VWGAFGVCGGLLGLALYWPLLADVLSVRPPGATGWALIAAGATTTWLIGQAYIALRGHRSDA